MFGIGRAHFYIMSLLVMVVIAMDIYNDVAVNVSYVKSSCVILDKKLNSRSRGDQPLIKVSHVLNSTTYYAWVYALHDRYKSLSDDNASKLLDNFQPGSSIVCWYDPANPYTIRIDNKFHFNELGLFFGTLIFLLFPYFYSRLYKNSSKQKSNAVINNLSTYPYEIIEHRFTIEYIYLGDEPITIDRVPEKFKNRNRFIKTKIVDKISEYGRFITLKKYVVLILAVVFSLIALLLWLPY